MKLNARTISVGLILIFIIALVVLYLGYQKQVTAQNLANQNLTSAQTAFNKSSTDKTNADKQLAQANDQLNKLQGQLSQAKQDLANKQTFLPTGVDGINYTDIIYETAQNANVKLQYPLQNLSQDAPSSVTNSGITFSTYSFSFTVKADNLTDIVNFINALCTQDPFKDATIESAAIGTIQDTITINNPDGTQTQTTLTHRTADIKITMYAYGG